MVVMQPSSSGLDGLSHPASPATAPYTRGAGRRGVLGVEGLSGTDGGAEVGARAEPDHGDDRGDRQDQQDDGPDEGGDVVEDADQDDRHQAVQEGDDATSSTPPTRARPRPTSSSGSPAPKPDSSPWAYSPADDGPWAGPAASALRSKRFSGVARYLS